MQSSRSALPTSWISRTNPDKSKKRTNPTSKNRSMPDKQKEPFAKTRKVLFLRGGAKAFLPEEGGTAQAVTEGAAREQVCIRENLMRICQFVKLPQSLPAANPAPSKREPDASPLNSDISRAAPDTPRGQPRRPRRTAGTACAYTAGKHPQVRRKTARAAQRHTRRRSAC